MLKGPNRKYVNLTKDNGEPTTAGLFWQQLTGEQLPESGYMSQAAVREGNVEYIKTRDGKRAITRRLNISNGEWIFTQLGLRYYKKLRRNYVVNVPVIIRGTPPDGRTYTKRASVPISKLGISSPNIALEPTMAQRLRKVKQLVLDQLPKDGPIYDLGYESYTLDEEGTWSIMEETVGTNPDTGAGEAYVNEGTAPAVNSRAMGALDVRQQLYKHEAICKEAFEQHSLMKCVPQADCISPGVKIRAGV